MASARCSSRRHFVTDDAFQGHYKGLQSLQCGASWRQYGVTHLVHIFSNGKLRSFSSLQTNFNLPQTMYFPYLQLHHAVQAQLEGSLSPAPIFHYMTEISHSKGFISRCYAKGFPTKVAPLWESEVGVFEDDQWGEVLQSIQSSSRDVAQRLSQLYIVLRVHLISARLWKMGLRENSECTRCSRDHGDLIHQLWCCPKLHLY